jgi:hypothetical protein
VEGTVEADDLYHTAGHKGQAKQGGTKSLGRKPRGRRKKREPGRGHYDKDRPAIIAWISRQGGVVVQATRDFIVKTVQKAADIALQRGSRLLTDSASSYRALTGYLHEYVNHTKKEVAYLGPADHYLVPQTGENAPLSRHCEGVCYDSVPIFLPDGCLGTPMALLHVACCLAQPRRGDTTEAR